MEDNPYRPGVPGSALKSSLLPRVVAALVVLAIVVIGVLMLIPASRYAREPALRSSCKNNLKNIALALHTYADAYGALPPAYTTDADGKPLHSWRTLILPFADGEQLYESIDLSKPWNDPVNAKACAARHAPYECPSAPKLGNRTTYLAVLTPESCLRASEPRELGEIVDGTAGTLMVIEVDTEHAVPWMAPLDADETLVLGLGEQSSLAHPNGTHGVFADAHVGFLPADLPAEKRRALVSIAAHDDAELEE